MKKITLSIIILLSAILLQAQTPQYYKGLGTSNSTFLLGYTNYAMHSQSIYTPYDLQHPLAGNISTIYYRYGDTGQLTGNTLYNFRAYFLQVSDSSFANTNDFFTGTTNVLTTDSLVIPPGTSGQWFPINLSSSFTYDPAQTLVVELRFDSVIIGNFGTYGTPNNGRKLISGDSTSTTGDASSSTWQDFGFDLGTVGITQPVSSGNDFSVIPVPFSNLLYMSTSINVSDATIEILDLTGKIIYHAAGLAGQSFVIPTEKFSPGIYFARFKSNSGSLVKKIVKE